LYLPVERGTGRKPLTGADSWGERLPRRLGLWSAVAVIMGTTIGSGIFRVPAVVAERLPSPMLFAAVWVVGGLLAMAGALAFAELSAMYPRSGGFYVYIREAFGPMAAFVFGWAELLVIRPASYGAISIVSAEYLWRLTGYDGGALLAPIPLSRAQVTASLLIVATAAVINLRHLMYGGALSPRFRGQPRWFRLLGPYFLLDQVFALTSVRTELDDDDWRRYYLATSLFSNEARACSNV